MRFVLIGIAALLLASCSTFDRPQTLDYDHDPAASPTGAEASLSPLNWSPPQYAGLTAGRVVYPTAAGPVVAEWVSGKEAEDATVTFATPDGNLVTYSAKGLRGFEGQLARADVEKHLAGELAGMWESLAPEMRRGLVDAVCTAVTGGACGLVN